MIGGPEAAKQYLISQGMWDHYRDLPVGALGDGNTAQSRDDVRELERAREYLRLAAKDGLKKREIISYVAGAATALDTALSQGDEQPDMQGGKITQAPPDERNQQEIDAAVRDLQEKLAAHNAPKPDTDGLAEYLDGLPVRARHYKYSDPVSGKSVWRNEYGTWNGQQPKGSVDLYDRQTVETALRTDRKAVLEEAAKVMLPLLFRESERASNAGDCACMSLSRSAEREYESYSCPHQNARKWLHQNGLLESEYPQAICALAEGAGK